MDVQKAAEIFCPMNQMKVMKVYSFVELQMLQLGLYIWVANNCNQNENSTHNQANKGHVVRMGHANCFEKGTSVGA